VIFLVGAIAQLTVAKSAIGYFSNGNATLRMLTHPLSRQQAICKLIGANPSKSEGGKRYI
jgi:hypothetical protein